jgi:hypothetical protein
VGEMGERDGVALGHEGLKGNITTWGS